MKIWRNRFWSVARPCLFQRSVLRQEPSALRASPGKTWLALARQTSAAPVAAVRARRRHGAVDHRLERGALRCPDEPRIGHRNRAGLTEDDTRRDHARRRRRRGGLRARCWSRSERRHRKSQQCAESVREAEAASHRVSGCERGHRAS